MVDITTPSGTASNDTQKVTLSADDLARLDAAWRDLREHVDAHHPQDEDLRAKVAGVEYALYPQRFVQGVELTEAERERVVTGVIWRDPEPTETAKIDWHALADAGIISRAAAIRLDLQRMINAINR